MFTLGGDITSQVMRTTPELTHLLLTSPPRQHEDFKSQRVSVPLHDIILRRESTCSEYLTNHTTQPKKWQHEGHRPHKLEPHSNDKDETWAGTPLPNYHTIPREDFEPRHALTPLHSLRLHLMILQS
ncbi:hypothetical protein TNCV_5085431 [Trichonephila clavipes]|uniref:Uncharacterized protein n=1 Tax=Trichonephila clavipes TaxID=2585209 RepID=A0A8X6VGV6_TRICX|nr:hypothetical protein TNCV_5085431 [Trichonephila clavipes]